MTDRTVIIKVFLQLRADDRCSNKFNKGSSFFIFSNRHLLFNKEP